MTVKMGKPAQPEKIGTHRVHVASHVSAVSAGRSGTIFGSLVRKQSEPFCFVWY